MAPKQRGMHVSFRNVTPLVLENEQERAMLKQDLEGLGCVGLLDRPWNLKSEEFIQQFVMIREQKVERCNIFDGTVHDRPEEWTAGVWREVYNFLPGGGGMANRTDQYVEGKFLHEADPKDGFPVREYRDAWERRLLEFLVPIVHPDKPTRVTCTLDNTIFGALGGQRLVNWAKIFAELVNRLVGAADKTKPTPIYPFFFHLYESKGLLTKDVETNYRAAEELTRYRITPDQDLESESDVLRITGLEPPHVAAPVNQVKQGNQREQTYRAPNGSPPIWSRREGSRPNSGIPQSEGARLGSPCPASPPPQQPQLDPQPKPERLEQPEEEEKPWIRKPFNAVVESYRVVKEQYQSLERILNSISLYLDVEPCYLLERI